MKTLDCESSVTPSNFPRSRVRGLAGVIRATAWFGAVAAVSVLGGLGASAADQKSMPAQTKHEEMTVPGIGIKLVKIPKGSFQMGHKDDYYGSSGDEKPEHKVTFTKDFWMGATAITVGQFKHFVEATGYITEAEIGNAGIYVQKTQPKQKGLNWRNPGIKGYQQTDNHPVLGISWDDAMQFCAWLNEREAAAGRLPEGYVYRLPTEAQWEYVARAGRVSDPGYWKELIETEEQLKKEGKPVPPLMVNSREKAAKDGYKEGEYGPERESVYRANSGGVPNPVGTKQPNIFGVYDMMGNGWNWVYDWYGKYPAEEQFDPQGPESANSREIIRPHHSMRGASWNEFGAHGMMSTNRWSTYGMTANQWVTFRIALTTVPAPSPTAPVPGAMIGSGPQFPAPAAAKGGQKKK
jgi:sulfatase modifying factor 1